MSTPAKSQRRSPSEYCLRSGPPSTGTLSTPPYSPPSLPSESILIAAARMISPKRWSDHVTPLLKTHQQFPIMPGYSPASLAWWTRLHLTGLKPSSQASSAPLGPTKACPQERLLYFSAVIHTLVWINHLSYLPKANLCCKMKDLPTVKGIFSVDMLRRETFKGPVALPTSPEIKWK